MDGFGPGTGRRGWGRRRPPARPGRGVRAAKLVGHRGRRDLRAAAARTAPGPSAVPARASASSPSAATVRAGVRRRWRNRERYTARKVQQVQIEEAVSTVRVSPPGARRSYRRSDAVDGGRPGCLWVAPGCRYRRRGEFVGRRLQPGPGSDVWSGVGRPPFRPDVRPRATEGTHVRTSAPRPHRTRRLRTALGFHAVGAALAVTGTLTAQADPAGTRTPAGSHPTARTEPAPAPADARDPGPHRPPVPVPPPARTAPPHRRPPRPPLPPCRPPRARCRPPPLPRPSTRPPHTGATDRHAGTGPSGARSAPPSPRHQRPGTPAPVPQQH